MSGAAPRCADLSAARHEPLVATASRVDRWVLLEHPGAWGPAAPPVTRLAPPVAQHLRDAARTVGARLLMIRRPHRLTTPGRWQYVVTSTPGQEQVLARHVDNDEQLLEPIPDTPGAGWERRAGRLWLVCTQGRHDLCCAVRGRPVATQMLAADPDGVWEASHIGGDRFAPNLVLLPEGHYFGRVEAGAVTDLMAGVVAGRLDLATWRGRSSLPLPVQAAQHFARAATGVQDLDAHPLLGQESLGTDTWRVSLGPDLEVVVEYVRDQPAAQLTCSADSLRVASTFALLSLTTATC